MCGWVGGGRVIQILSGPMGDVWLACLLAT